MPYGVLSDRCTLRVVGERARARLGGGCQLYAWRPGRVCAGVTRRNERIRVPVPEPAFDMKIYPLSWGTHDAALMPHIIVGHAQCGLDAAHSLLPFGGIPDWNSRSLGQREEVDAVALRTPMHVSIVRGRADVFPLMGGCIKRRGNCSDQKPLKAATA